MNEGFEVEFRGDHVHVQIGPDYEFDPSGRDEVWKKIRSICEENGSCRVLVEGMVPTGERNTAEVVAAGERAATIPNLWMAFHLEDFVPDEQSELFKVIAATRGVRVRFFSDQEEALQWLRSNAPA